jgi:hypothetical protein
MILMDLIFFVVVAILYNAETWPMWKIYSAPCDSALNKFYFMSLLWKSAARQGKGSIALQP